MLHLMNDIPRGSIYTTIMELDPQSHDRNGLLGPNSILVVYMDPLGFRTYTEESWLLMQQPVEPCTLKPAERGHFSTLHTYMLIPEGPQILQF